ncbi:MAG: hypothetical protein LUQ37_09620 [Methanoregulaceae archaeon]|nr:hypothetical protein [Methanoregulaceae archaeon]
MRRRLCLHRRVHDGLALHRRGSRRRSGNLLLVFSDLLHRDASSPNMLLEMSLVMLILVVRDGHRLTHAQALASDDRLHLELGGGAMEESLGTIHRRVGDLPHG